MNRALRMASSNPRKEFSLEKPVGLALRDILGYMDRCGEGRLVTISKVIVLVELCTLH